MREDDSIMELEVRTSDPELASGMRALGATCGGLILVTALCVELAEDRAGEIGTDQDRESWLALLLQQSLKDDLELFMAAHETIERTLAEFNQGYAPVLERLKLERGADGESPQTEWREPSPYAKPGPEFDKQIAMAGLDLHREVLAVVESLVAKNPARGTAAAQSLMQLSDGLEKFEKIVFPIGDVSRETNEPVGPTDEPDRSPE